MSLADMLPERLRQSQEVLAMQDAFGTQTDTLTATLDDFTSQLSPLTATWGLQYWEKAFGIPTEAERPLEFRRSRVVAKFRGQGTTTTELIREVAESFTNGAVEVTEFPSEYRIELRFVDAVGLPPNLEDLKAAIAEIIPAHIAVGYQSTLKTWDDVGHLTWDDVATMTWETLRGGTIS